MTTQYSVINFTFPKDREKVVGQMEAVFGLGTLLGPSIGSFVNGAVGYEMTWYFFAF